MIAVTSVLTTNSEPMKPIHLLARFNKQFPSDPWTAATDPFF